MNKINKMISGMMTIFYVVIVSVFISSCASYKLDLNIDQSVAQNLPKELAVKYLTEMNDKYPVAIHSRYLKPWNNNCKYSEEFVWLPVVGEKYPYNSATMKYYITNNPGYQQLSIWLEDVGDESCYVISIEKRDRPENSKKSFIEIGKKIATALRSLGVKIEQDK